MGGPGNSVTTFPRSRRESPAPCRHESHTQRYDGCLQLPISLSSPNTCVETSMCSFVGSGFGRAMAGFSSPFSSPYHLAKLAVVAGLSQLARLTTRWGYGGIQGLFALAESWSQTVIPVARPSARCDRQPLFGSGVVQHCCAVITVSGCGMR